MRSFTRDRMSNLATRFAIQFQRLRSDVRGVAAVEFAMLLPVMFILFVGTVEFGQAIAVDRRVTLSASSTADLIARAPSEGLTVDQVDAELNILEQLMRPYDASLLTLRIVSVIANSPQGKLEYKVDWSRDNDGGTPYAHDATYDTDDSSDPKHTSKIPQGLLSNLDSVIIAEATYNYTPLIFSYFLKGPFQFQKTFFAKPRNASCVLLKTTFDCRTGVPLS
ncbi:MAG: TadE/TadG family type IV pilus assembly protein [Hyphomicrobiaceae bacterium]